MSISYWACPILLFATIPSVDAEEKLLTKSYPVADLVIPLNTSGSAKAPSKTLASGTCETELIRTIARSVAPESWSDNGGRGTIAYYPLGMTVVVEQTSAIHRRIESLLQALRQEIDREVSMEFRLVTMPQTVWERWLKERNFADQGKWYAHKRLVLEATETARFLETVQSEPKSTVHQLPKITAFTGQRCCFETGEKTRLCAQPSLDEAGKSIAVAFAFSSPRGSMDSLVVAQSGQTAVLGGWSANAEKVATEAMPPMIGKIPYADRLFKPTPQVTVLLLTPRVVFDADAPSNAGYRMIRRVSAAMAKAVNGLAHDPLAFIPTTRPTVKLTLTIGIDFEDPQPEITQTGGIIRDGKFEPIRDAKGNEVGNPPLHVGKFTPIPMKIIRGPANDRIGNRIGAQTTRFAADYIGAVAAIAQEWIPPLYGIPLAEPLPFPGDE